MVMRGIFLAPSAYSGKPLRVVRYTSGSGTFTPLAVDSWVRVTVVAGGGGGGGVAAGGVVSGGLGGHAGCTSFAWLMLTGPVDYSVGAGGAPGSPGNPSFFHTVKAWCSTPDYAIPNDIYHVVVGGVGMSGGSNVSTPGHSGRMPGCSQNLSASIWAGRSLGGGISGWGGGGGGGGDSLYGVGGNGGNGAISEFSAGSVGQNGKGYGAGGGGAGGSTWNSAPLVLGGSGSGGIIIIEEFGA